MSVTSLRSVLTSMPSRRAQGSFSRAEADGDSSPRPARPSSADNSPEAWRLWSLFALVVGCCFVLVGGGSLDLSAEEARLGLAAREAWKPLGQVYGGWEPSLLPGRVLATRAWAWLEGGMASAASVRWPEAISAILAGWLLCRRVMRTEGVRAGLFSAIGLFGSVAWIHHTRPAGLDFLGALPYIAALDCLVQGGSGWLAGSFCAIGFLISGWPGLLLVALPLIVLGKGSVRTYLSGLLPILTAILGWSAWALAECSTESWAAALALPLTKGPSLFLGWNALLLGLPLLPLASLAAFPKVREAASPEGRSLLASWFQIGVVALAAGSLIPGLHALALPVVLGCAGVMLGIALDGFLSRADCRGAGWLFAGVVAVEVLIWTLISVLGGGYLAAAVSYYRQLSILLVALGLALVALSNVAWWKASRQLALASLVGIVLCVKLVHWGVYVPEWNYRLSQGPWGRAIGQWVLPNKPIHVFHHWPADLMFHTQRPIRQLPEPLALKYRESGEPLYVLLQAAEYEHWPEKAPRILKVREFSDPSGFGTRVLARTEGELLTIAAASSSEAER